MEDLDTKSRKIVLSETISSMSCKDIISKIVELNEDDSKNEEKYKKFKRKPILLYINSFGGSIYDGLALYDIIDKSKTPIYTIAIGSVMSMGLPIYLAGKKRYVGKHATLMIHDASTFIWDKLETIKLELNEAERLRDILFKIIVSKSNITQEMIDEYIIKKSNWYIPAEEAMKLRLCDSYWIEK